MKNLRTLLASLLLLTAVTVSAQAEERQILTVTVPFPFAVQNTNLPAGSYTLYTLSPFNLLKVQSVDHRRSAYVTFVRAEGSASRSAKLVFRRIGTKYFLTQAWEDGNNIHRDVPTGDLARELAKAGQSIHETTILAGGGSR